MVKISTISVREYARRLNIDEKAVRQAISKGLITKKAYDVKAKKINPSVANKEWGHKHKVVKARAGVSRAKAIEKINPDVKQGVQAPLIEEETLDKLLESLRIRSTMGASEAMRVREVIGAALDKKKLEEAEGRLVSRDKVEKALFVVGNELKKALYNIPQRIVRDIMAAPNEVDAINIFNDELSQVLNSYGSLKPTFSNA